jgi:sec-independent protein translocase protein TatB
VPSIGLQEIVLILLVVVVFLQPKELPGLFRRAGNAYRRIVEMRRDFLRTLENLEREAERSRDGGSPTGGADGEAKEG